jgi:hypothetical protein
VLLGTSWSDSFFLLYYRLREAEVVDCFASAHASLHNARMSITTAKTAVQSWEQQDSAPKTSKLFR